MDSDTDRIAQVWPEWKAEELIGRGGFGSVYRASRTIAGHTSTAAVKIIDVPNDTADVRELRSMGMDDVSIHDYFGKAARSLLNEIAAMDSLKGSANIVQIEDYQLREQKDGPGWTVFIRMELLESLEAYQERTGLPDQWETARIGVQISSALARCHAIGIIHRDVKPANIFRNKFGDYKLGDFGIAKNLENATRSNMSFAGTRPFMAPEVEGGRYDKSVDTYSLGIMLYRWLNGGRPPFLPAAGNVDQTDLQAAQLRRLSGERPPLPAGGGVDPALATIVARACEPDPKDRWNSATDFGRALQGWLEAHPAHAVATATNTGNPTGAPSPDDTGVEGLLTSDQTINVNAWIGKRATQTVKPAEAARRGYNVLLNAPVPAEIANAGGVVEIGYQAEGTNRRIQMRIPAGTHDGTVLRFTGYGCPGKGGAAAGDLLATVSIIAPVAGQAHISSDKRRRMNGPALMRFVVVLAVITILARVFVAFVLAGEPPLMQIILLFGDIIIAVLAFKQSKGLEKALGAILFIDAIVTLAPNLSTITTGFTGASDAESLGAAFGFLIGFTLVPLTEVIAAFVLLGPRRLMNPASKVVVGCTAVVSVLLALNVLQVVTVVTVDTSIVVVFFMEWTHCMAIALFCRARAKQDDIGHNAMA